LTYISGFEIESYPKIGLITEPDTLAEATIDAPRKHAISKESDRLDDRKVADPPISHDGQSDVNHTLIRHQWINESSGKPGRKQKAVSMRREKEKIDFPIALGSQEAPSVIETKAVRMAHMT
jgi:hypothetical protein